MPVSKSILKWKTYCASVSEIAHYESMSVCGVVLVVYRRSYTSEYIAEVNNVVQGLFPTLDRAKTVAERKALDVLREAVRELEALTNG